MRDYIILNGKRSTLVRGLMICKLPPITKPAIRTSTITIDGRDGDIVTPLGYQSYDKKIEIGLYDDFDVDEVISYFTGSGTVTFSNEITKYYRYRIDNQIDFEKLIRFRTAKVTLHVQPFKYSTTAQPLVWNVKREIICVPDYNGSTYKNGITVQAQDGGKQIKLTGTTTAYTELYIPVDRLVVQGGGKYALDVETNAESSGADNIDLRLIGDTPADGDSFGTGNKTATLADGETATLTDTLTAAKQYKYLYLTIPAGATVDTVITPTMAALKPDGVVVGKKIIRAATNSGNILSRPIIRVYGSGTVVLSRHYNEGDVTNTITIDMTGITGGLTIDVEAQEAYEGTVQNLKTRKITGDFTKLTFNPGPNRIEATVTSVAGLLDKIEIDNYSRWI